VESRDPGLGADVAVAPGYPAKACIVCKSNQSVNWSLKVLQDRPCPYSPLWAWVLAIGVGKSCKGV